MKGIGKRVTVAFLSIVALLTVSGVISLFELSNLSYDTDAILSANSRDMKVANDLLRIAHDHSRAMEDVVVHDYGEYMVSCQSALSELDSQLVSLRNTSPIAAKGALDTLTMYSTELRQLTDEFAENGLVLFDELGVGVGSMEGYEWYSKRYKPVYERFVEQVKRYITLSHSEVAPRAAQLSKNAYRAVTPVLISLAVMIAIVLMFYYFVYIYGVKPIKSINRALADHLSFKLPYKPKAEMVDELKELSDNIENLINLSKSNKKADNDAI